MVFAVLPIPPNRHQFQPGLALLTPNTFGVVARSTPERNNPPRIDPNSTTDQICNRQKRLGPLRDPPQIKSDPPQIDPNSTTDHRQKDWGQWEPTPTNPRSSQIRETHFRGTHAIVGHVPTPTTFVGRMRILQRAIPTRGPVWHLK